MSTPGSSPYAGGRSDDVYEYDDSHSQGLVTFAGVMIMIAAVLNTLYGIAAIDKANFFVNDARYVFADLATFGWFVLILGIVQFFAALAIWKGTPWGRWFGVACAFVNVILQMLWIPVRPCAGDDDPHPRHHRDLRPARLRRPAPRGARVAGAGGGTRRRRELTARRRRPGQAGRDAPARFGCRHRGRRSTPGVASLDGIPPS